MNSLNGMDAIIPDISNLLPYVPVIGSLRAKCVKVILIFHFVMYGILSFTLRNAQIEKDVENILCLVLGSDC
jgi:hypothetical protein